MTAALEVVRVSDPRAWGRLKDEWNALFATSMRASPPLSWRWQSLWWELYGEEYAAALCLITVRSEGRLVGLLPLYEARCRTLVPFRRLRFVSTGAEAFEDICPDYLDLLAAPEDELAVADAILPELLGLGWDEVELAELGLQSVLRSWTRRLPLRVRAIEGRDETCPVANLSGGFDAYEMRLSSTKRSVHRKLLRDAEKAGATFELATVATLDSHYDDLVRVHQERWTAVGKPGVFAAERFLEFHRRLARTWVESGTAVLCRLRIGDRALAVLYGFIVGDKFDFYQSGVVRDDSSVLKSPGITAHVLLMRHLAGRGVARYDFLRGPSAYKERFATDETSVAALRLRRANVHALAEDIELLAPRAAKKVARMARAFAVHAKRRVLERLGWSE